VNEEQRVRLWRTAWGVALAATTAFTIGYAASHFADPSIGAERTPLWPVFVSLALALASLWFLLAPTLHRPPFAPRPDAPADHDDVWLGQLADTEDTDAPLGTFRVDTPSHHDQPTG